MAYKTILVHVDQSRHAPARIRLAAAMAREHDAHLVGAAMTGISRYVFPDGAWPLPQTLAASCFDPLYKAAQGALDQFGALAAPFEVSLEPRLVADQDSDALALLARFCDLVVITQDDPAEALPGQAVRLQEYVAVNATAPVLVVPVGWTSTAPPGAVLLAWNGSAAAANACHAALPQLRRAAAVHLATFDAGPEQRSTTLAEHAALLEWLARHGVPAQAHVRAQEADAGDGILALARTLGCDLVVMGCYGHSRFRELLLGGATRTILRSAAIPVLMAH